MLDHIGIPVHDLDTSREFYRRALAPLGIELLMEVSAQETGSPTGAIGFGANQHPFFWIGGDVPGQGVHLAFRAESRSQVDAFYDAALAAGARDNGAPGLRTHYHPHYYSAFVIDPNGVNLEAVCHKPG
jgi:catechol 2,3-dioxygenase-like lactoylglutathione lyase family enzyme